MVTAPAHVTFAYEGRVLGGVLKRLQGKRRLIHVLDDPAHVLDRAGGALAFLSTEIDIESWQPVARSPKRHKSQAAR